MAIRFDIFGRTYSDDIPVFIAVEGGEWDRVGKRYLVTGELDLVAKRKKGYVFPPYERGEAPGWYYDDAGLAPPRSQDDPPETEPEPEPEPELEPEPTPEKPQASWTRRDIIGWLEGQGVDLTVGARSRLNKAELLAMVEHLDEE